MALPPAAGVPLKMTMNNTDKAYFQQEFKDTRKEIKDVHKRLDPVCEQVATNKADITWLKKSHAAVVTVAGSVVAALILWAVFGGG